jgi:hypothetical protein
VSTKFSRRKMILAGGAALIAPAVMAKTKLLRVAPQQSSERAVSAISGSEKGFGAALEALFPGLMSDPTFQKIAPLAILITNEKGPDVRAHSIAWQITTAAGMYGTALFSYVSPGSATKGQSVSTLGSGRQAILRTGQSRLVTPFFNWSPAFYQRNPQPDWKALLQPVEPGAFLLSELANATEVKVSLDGAVFSDWQMVGPNKFRLAKRLRNRRDAERDEGRVVHKLLKAKAPDSVIVQTLQSHASAPRSSQSKPGPYLYEQARRFQAQVLLRAFNEADRASFETALRRLVFQKKTLITRHNG